MFNNADDNINMNSDDIIALLEEDEEEDRNAPKFL